MLKQLLLIEIQLKASLHHLYGANPSSRCFDLCHIFCRWKNQSYLAIFLVLQFLERKKSGPINVIKKIIIIALKVSLLFLYSNLSLACNMTEFERGQKSIGRSYFEYQIHLVLNDMPQYVFVLKVFRKSNQFQYSRNRYAFTVYFYKSVYRLY